MHQNFKYVGVVLAILLVIFVCIYLYSGRYRETEVASSEDRFLVSNQNAEIEKQEKEVTDYENGKVAVEGIIKIDFDEAKQKFIIDGAENPQLTFWSKTGTSAFYEFQNVSGHPFYFGMTEEGSPDMADALDLYKGKPQALTEGSIFFNFDQHAPGQFYYHSPQVENAGNKVSFIKTV